MEIHHSDEGASCGSTCPELGSTLAAGQTHTAALISSTEDTRVSVKSHPSSSCRAQRDSESKRHRNFTRRGQARPLRPAVRSRVVDLRRRLNTKVHRLNTVHTRNRSAALPLSTTTSSTPLVIAPSRRSKAVVRSPRGRVQRGTGSRGRTQTRRRREGR